MIEKSRFDVLYNILSVVLAVRMLAIKNSKWFSQICHSLFEIRHQNSSVVTVSF